MPGRRELDPLLISGIIIRLAHRAALLISGIIIRLAHRAALRPGVKPSIASQQGGGLRN